jgi:hypothetical protein
MVDPTLPRYGTDVMTQHREFSTVSAVWDWLNAVGRSECMFLARCGLESSRGFENIQTCGQRETIRRTYAG